MFVVFIMSLILAIPPLMMAIYLWTSVARYYEELKQYDKSVKHLPRKQQYTPIRLVGSLIVTTPDQDHCSTP